MARRAPVRKARSVGMPCMKFSDWWWMKKWMLRKPMRSRLRKRSLVNGMRCSPSTCTLPLPSGGSTA